LNPQPLRDGVRWLTGKPIPTILAGLVLALAMGIGTAAFSVMNAAFFRPPPYSDAKQIVAISNFWMQRGYDVGVALPRFLDIKNSNRSFQTVAAFRTFNQTFVLGGTEEPQLLHGALVSEDFFRLFGVSPIFGRTFESRAELSGSIRTVVLSYGLWCRQYSCDRNILGRPVVLDGQEFVAIGVMPESFKNYGAGARPMDLWLPLPMAGEALTDRGARDLHVLARLKKGITLQQAQAEASVMDHQLAGRYPETDKDLFFRLSYWWMSVTSQSRPALALLSAAVGLLLLIACSSMAFVLLAKAFSREKEIAIRLACGASRSRLVAASLIEGLLYGSLAGCVGTAVAFWATGFIVSMVPESIYIPRLNEASIDAQVLAFSIAMAIFTGLIFGLIPIFSMIQMQPFARLRGGAGAVMGGTRKKLRTSLVTLQMAVAIILSVGTGLVVKSFGHLTHVPLGFNSDNIWVSEVPLSPALTRQPVAWRNYWQQVSERLNAGPGVESATIVSPLPFGDEVFAATITSPDSNTKLVACLRYISPAFSRTLGVTLIIGRQFSNDDYVSKSEAVIVNRVLVRSFWGDESPLGKRISVESEHSYTIVGVFQDFRDVSRRDPIAPEIYFPFGKDVTPFAAAMVRIKPPTNSFIAVISDQIRAVDKSQPVPKVRSMISFVSDDLSSTRFFSVFLGTLAGAALLLALLGIYGALSLSVGQRTREIAIRTALGAERMNIFKLVMKESFTTVLAAEIIGIAGAVTLGRFLSALLFDVSATDPVTLATVGLVLAITAVSASYVPTRTAMAVDPATILRGE
jgi:putative ABC transport system permease protein